MAAISPGADARTAAEELQGIASRDRAILDSVGDGLYGLDLHGRITFINPAAAEQLGYEPQELIGAGSHRTFHHTRVDGSPYPEAECPIFRAYHEGLVRRGAEEAYWRKDGSRLLVEYVSTPIREDGRITGAVVAFRDIEQRKRVEEALRQSENSLKQAQRIAALGNWDLDLVGDVLTWSDEIYRIFEIDRERFGASYRAFLEAIHPEDRGLVDRAYTESVANRSRYDIVHRLLMKDGRVKVVHEQCETFYDQAGRPLRSIGTVQDITERRWAEEALRKERDLVSAVMETSPVAILRVDESGFIAFANAEAERIMGVPRGGIVGRKSSSFAWRKADAGGAPLPEDDLPSAMTMRTGRPQSVSLAIEQSDGRRVWLNVRSAPIHDGAGRTEGCVLAMEDVTDRRRMEEQLHQSRKLEAIGQLAGGVAHDFNNLLTAILGSCDLLLERMPEVDPLREEAREIGAAARKAVLLTRQLLAFSRKQVVQPRVLDLDEIVDAMDKMLRRLIGEDVELVAVRGQALGRVKADPGQMEQVLVNLAVNARDAMPRGGRLTIETTNVDLGEEQARRHVGARAGRYVMLAVSDTGCGMSEETQSHLFEPFFTTKEKGKGTGLGLSTVYGIVKQAGGDIWVYSELGKGSVFKIFLPRTEEEQEAAAEAPAQAPAARGAETVLLVEDEAQVRAVVARVLRGAGYTVLEASDGEEALRLAVSAAGKVIDLLMSDLVMPRMGGEVLASRLRAAYPDLKVLLVSGYTESGGALRDALDEGMAFLQKPFTPSTLAHKIRELLDRPRAGAAAS